jgi:hypothetical protein
MVSDYNFKFYIPYMWPVHEITDQTSNFILTLHSHPKEDEYEQYMISSLNANPCMAEFKCYSEVSMNIVQVFEVCIYSHL